MTRASSSRLDRAVSDVSRRERFAFGMRLAVGVSAMALAALSLLALTASVHVGIASSAASPVPQAGPPVSPPVSPPVPPPSDVAAIGESQEPPCLNVYLASCASDVTRQVTGPVLVGAYRVRPDLSYEPVLVERVRVGTTPFSLTYYLRPEAKWSDGVPVTADDLLFTAETIRNPANDIASRDGYDRIVEAVKVDAKTVRFVFSRPFSAWRSLFPQILPKHVLEGQDFNTAQLASIPVASGPFEFESWNRGTQIGLVRNNDWWGPHAPGLDAVEFRFVPSTTDQVQALLSGELTAIHPLVSEPLAPLQGAPGIAFESDPGLTIEHLDFNTASATMPLLRERWFREAVAYALDRNSSIVDAWSPLTLGVEPLDSFGYLSQQTDYRPVFDGYRYDPGRVASILKRHGCTPTADGIWSCRGTRASIRFATTTGNARRAFIQEQLRVKARAAGIELVPDNSPQLVLFNTRLPAGDFELTMFAWLRTPDPFGLASQYGCGGVQNWMRYCSPRVTEYLKAADEDVSRTTGLVLRADALLANDLPSIPFYQYPLVLAYRTELQGLANNPGPQGLTWNVEEWRLD